MLLSDLKADEKHSLWIALKYLQIMDHLGQRLPLPHQVTARCCKTELLADFELSITYLNSVNSG